MRLLAIFAIGFVSLCGVARGQDEAGPRAYSVPYKISPVYHLLVRAKVNGAGPMNFIIDTGCNVVIMTPEAVRQFGIAQKNGRWDRIEFEGGVVIENNRCNINTPAQVAMLNRNNSEGAPLHGVVGMDILKRFKIDLDYDNHKMTWTPTSLVKEAPKEGKDAIVAPVELSATDHVIVMVKLNGKGPYRFLYDTGAPATVVSPRLMKAGADKSAIVDSLEIGGLEVKKAPVFVMQAGGFDKTDGIIGFPLIAKYKTSMNFPKRSVLFEPGTYDVPPVPLSVVNGRPATLKEPEGRSLGVGFHQESDKKPGLEIEKVVPESLAAEAGLKVGDRLLAVDDVWMSVPTDCRWVMNRVKAGSTVDVKIHRDGKEAVVKLNVKEK